MKLTTRGKTLKITLGETCSIIDVEAHTELLRNMPSLVTRIVLNIRSIAELDTAYLQCIYALKQEADASGIAIQTPGKNNLLDHACRLYGLKALDSSETKSK